MRLAEAVALVTGGSSGIGAATARALAAAGALPVIAGRDCGRLRAVARETGGIPLQIDLADPDGPARLAEAALSAAGHIDLLVSNAGIGWSGPIDQLPAAKTAELIAVNLTAPIELTRLLTPGMIDRGHGRIIFVSSIAGATGVRKEALYSATKAGLSCFAETATCELTARGVGVSLIVPGVVDTPFFDRRGHPYDRRRPAPIHSERVARAIIYAAERDRAVVYVPGWMRLPAWLHGAAPGAFRFLASRYG